MCCPHCTKNQSQVIPKTGAREKEWTTVESPSSDTWEGEKRAWVEQTDLPGRQYKLREIGPKSWTTRCQIYCHLKFDASSSRQPVPIKHKWCDMISSRLRNTMPVPLFSAPWNMSIRRSKRSTNKRLQSSLDNTNVHIGGISRDEVLTDDHYSVWRRTILTRFSKTWWKNAGKIGGRDFRRELRWKKRVEVSSARERLMSVWVD